MPRTDHPEIQRRIYDREVERGASPAAVETARIRLIRRFAQGLATGKLLDVGCSDGSVIAPLASYHRPSGIDILDKSVEEARRNGVDAMRCDVESVLPFADGIFDIVVSAEIIENVVRTDSFLHEMNLVTHLGGHLIITTPNVASLMSYLMMALLDFPPYMAARYRSPHVRDFTIRTLKAALRNHGFEPLAVRGGELELPIFGKVLPSVGYILPRLSPWMVILAKKVAESRLEPEKEIEFFLKV